MCEHVSLTETLHFVQGGLMVTYDLGNPFRSVPGGLFSAGLEKYIASWLPENRVGEAKSEFDT